jgi:hypothetical protein
MKLGDMVQFALSSGNQGRILVGRLVYLCGRLARVRCGNRIHVLDSEGVFPLAGGVR